MNIFKKYFYSFIIFFAFSLLIVSCDRDEEDVKPAEAPTQNLSEVVYKTANTNLFLQAIAHAGLSNVLTDAGPVTVFIPTNAAMQSLLKQLGVSTVTDVPAATLANILKYHVVSGSVVSTALTTSQVPTALTGSSIGVVVSGTTITLNGEATITTKDRLATNGVAHLINVVLSEQPTQTVANAINTLATATGPKFTLLNKAIQKAGLTDLLNTTSGLTLFAPTDAAFNAAGLNSAAIDAATIEVLMNTLKYHVLAGFNYSNQLTSGRVFTLLGASGTARGLDIVRTGAAISLNPTKLLPNGSRVTDANILSTNGVIHQVDVLLTPKQYIWERLSSSNFRYQEFRTALTNGNHADLVATLTGETKYSLFVPAPSALTPIQNGPYTEAEKRDILERHIFKLSDNNNFTTIASIADGSKLKSIGGDEYFITRNAGGTYFNGTWTTTRASGAADNSHLDIDTYNGNLTAIGANFNGGTGAYISGNVGVLVGLPMDKLNTVIDTDASISLFAAAVKKLGLLSDAKNYTVFAVDNNAFDDVYADLGIADVSALNALDPENEEDALVLADLRDIVSAYVVEKVEFVIDIVNDLPALTAVAGNKITFIENSDIGFIQILNFLGAVQDNIDILDVDLKANNGVIHIIDGLLLVE